MGLIRQAGPSGNPSILIQQREQKEESKDSLGTAIPCLSAFERELPPLLADESMLSAPFLLLCYGIQGTLKEVEKEGPIQ